MIMLKGYKQADYSPENWAVLLDIKAAADAEIDNAASIADVMAALSNAETAMDAVHTLLVDAKAAAHASLNAALAGYSQADYSPENWTVLLNAMAMGDTEHAASVEDVTAALNSAEAAMAAVHTLLTDARIAAHASLETALAAYSEADYTPENWTVLAGFKTAGDAAIDEAADLDGVEAARLAASAGMGGVQTIAQALAAAKAAAHDALAAALGLNVSNETAQEGEAVAEAEGCGEPAVDVAPVADQTEEPAVEVLPAAETETEVAATETEGDAVTPSQEEPETSTPEAAEEKPADAEPAPESAAPDIDQA